MFTDRRSRSPISASCAHTSTRTARSRTSTPHDRAAAKQELEAKIDANTEEVDGISPRPKRPSTTPEEKAIFAS